MDEIHDQLEALGATVVGIRNLLLRKLWSIVEDQPHLGCDVFAQSLGERRYFLSMTRM